VDSHPCLPLLSPLSRAQALLQITSPAAQKCAHPTWAGGSETMRASILFACQLNAPSRPPLP